ncbi:XisH family protein [Sphaerospermopsis sp. LEGE 00249]|uniref:XisH family protein n=1 Tax=Sphaerospermopsis sp. LEGE 00249 TaxID=1380707 RepID=UPI00164D6443|nr:XisH family protein [Sphaerospermopsis sp. LEGE 00249]MBC5796389.1 XisH family protein [Sphaerospermopsis sp. LEGE 00249]
MSARDTYHEAIKNALIKDGWMIIRDPYTIKYEEIQLFADLLADRTLEIERNGQQIIVEVKSFISRSPMREFETALGQYIIYRTLLKVILPEAKIYVGVSRSIYKSFFLQKAISFIIEENGLRLIVVDLNKEEIIQWIN